MLTDQELARAKDIIRPRIRMYQRLVELPLNKLNLEEMQLALKVLQEADSSN